jgi:hypothetical protein
MDLPLDAFLQGVEEKNIYLFKNTSLRTNDHMHICLKNPDGRVLHFVCCTSKMNTPLKHIESKKLPYSTFVGIEPDESNKLKTMTYINCNTVIPFEAEEFVKQYKNRNIKHIGHVSDEIYENILVGIKASPMIRNEIKKSLELL